MPDEKNSELEFARLMGALLEADKKKQMDGLKARFGSKVDAETLEALTDGLTFDGNEGVKMKFVDGIGSYNVVLRKEFPGGLVKRIAPKSFYRRQIRHWMWNIDKGTIRLSLRILDLLLHLNCIQGRELHL